MLDDWLFLCACQYLTSYAFGWRCARGVYSCGVIRRTSGDLQEPIYDHAPACIQQRMQWVTRIDSGIELIQSRNREIPLTGVAPPVI